MGGIDWAGELAGYGVAAFTFGGLARTLREGVVIRVALLGGLLRGRSRLDALLYGLALAITLAVVALAVRYVWLSVLRHWRRGTVGPTTAEVPMRLPEGVVLAWPVLVLVQVAAMLAGLLTGHRAGAGETLGAQARRQPQAEG